MIQRSTSDLDSVVTTEEIGRLTDADSKSTATSAGAGPGCCLHGTPQSRLIPRVQVAHSRSDQRVPVYRDQTVPVWSFKDAAVSTERNVQNSKCGREVSLSRAYRGGCRKSNQNNLMTGCFCSKTPVMDSDPFIPNTESPRNTPYFECSKEELKTSDQRRTPVAVSDSASKVSFDAIMSMYQGSLVEKNHKWTSKDWWILGAILKRKSRERYEACRRPWRNCGAHLLHTSVDIPILKSLTVCPCSSRRVVSRLRLGGLSEGPVRSFQLAIDRAIVPSNGETTHSNLHCSSLLESGEYRQSKRCNFEPQYRHIHDPSTLKN